MRVKAPATTANLGPGFDCFGLALAHPFDVVEVERSEGLTLETAGDFGDVVPTGPRANTAGVVALEMLDGKGVRMRIEKGVRPSSGLGSSAASAVGAAVAINELYDLGYSDEELVAFAAEGERAAAGEPHRDNVAPSLLGGFTIIGGGEVFRMEPPEFEVAVALPDVELSTRRAREVLPEDVPLGKAVENVSSASLVAAGVALGDPSLMGSGMRDAVVEPRRSPLVPGLEVVRGAALDAGAHGVALSGAGPSVVAVCGEGSGVAEAMESAFRGEGVDAESFVTEPGPGARLLDQP